MLTVRLTPDAARAMRSACIRGGAREVGGLLFAEHVDDEVFVVLEATVADVGLIARFVRSVKHVVERLDAFFDRTGRQYRRFNYLGEWHSHPGYALHPSSVDDASMHEILSDPDSNARFVILVIVQLDEKAALRGGAWAYFPEDERELCKLEVG